jgi:hypothetical protein
MVRCALHQFKKKRAIEALGSWLGHCGGKEVVPLKRDNKEGNIGCSGFRDSAGWDK